MMTRKNKNHKQFMMLMTAFMMSSTSFAHDAYVDGIYYNLDKTKKEATVTFKGDGTKSDSYSKSVTIPETVNVGGVTYSVTFIGNAAFGNSHSVTSVSIPNTVTKIGYGAFYGTALTSIYIPKSVSFIDEMAFNSCNSMTSMTVDKENTTFDNRDNCNAIIHTETNELVSGCATSVIPNTVVRIANWAFYCNDGIKNINIPESVISIGNYAFGVCPGLTNIVIPNSVQFIGTGAFSGCYNATSVTISNSLKEISTDAFAWCNKLTDVNIPESVTTIGQGAFRDCTNLNSITIGSSVSYIDNEAFKNCNYISTITNKATTPQTLGEGAFKELNSWVELHVPEGTKNVYKDKNTWNQCNIIDDLKLSAEQEKGGSTTIASIERSKSIVAEKIFSISGKCQNKPVKGLNIINGKKFLVK